MRAQIIEKYQKKSASNGGKSSKESSDNLGNSFEETRACHTRTLIKVSKVTNESSDYLRIL